MDPATRYAAAHEVARQKKVEPRVSRKNRGRKEQRKRRNGTKRIKPGLLIPCGKVELGETPHTLTGGGDLHYIAKMA
jgi:hypothetical protein